MHCPMGIAIKRNGDVIVTEYENHRVKIFSQENLGESTIMGAVGVGAGKFACPRGVALDHNENILVADSQNYRIQVVSSTGEPLGTFGMIGSDPGCLDTPYDVAMDINGNIIVADTKNHRLQVFTRLVPVYAGPAMYDEEYEAAVEIEDGEGLGTNEDEISNSFDEAAQACNNNITSEAKADESLNRDNVQENNEEDQRGNKEANKLQVVKEAKPTENVNSENLEESKQVSEGNQEMDINNNMANSST